MNIKKRANPAAGPNNRHTAILSRGQAAIKSVVVTLALWHLLPTGFADWLVRRLNLGGA